MVHALPQLVIAIETEQPTLLDELCDLARERVEDNGLHRLETTGELLAAPSPRYSPPVRVEQVWRFPVKSLGGERLETCNALETGLEGDRRFGLRDTSTGYVLTARREPLLLQASARLLNPEEVEIVLPGGEQTADDTVLSDWLGRRVELVRAGSVPATFEGVDDPESELDWGLWQGPSETLHDSGAARVSLVSTATIGAWDVRRFRANLVLDGAGEDELVGQTITVAACELSVTQRISRCVMVTRPQPGLERDLDVLRTISRERDACLAIGALVVSPGRVSVGDPVIVAV